MSATPEQIPAKALLNIKPGMVEVAVWYDGGPAGNTATVGFFPDCMQWLPVTHPTADDSSHVLATLAGTEYRIPKCADVVVRTVTP